MQTTVFPSVVTCGRALPLPSHWQRPARGTVSGMPNADRATLVDQMYVLSAIRLPLPPVTVSSRTLSGTAGFVLLVPLYV